ncbi:Transcription initiation factor TFIID subunit 9B [Allomyces javanicus]|nr:Transcription initiation factor TFIID subunit 9B [Allomyces javanicus]
MTTHSLPSASDASAAGAQATTANGTTTAPADDRPRDVRLVELMLQTAGIHDCDEQVIPMLLEFGYRYVTDVLTEALLFADHAGHADINTDDVKLAIQSRVNHSFTAPPPKDFLLELAAKKNEQPLPLVGEKYGLRLPPQQFTLTNVNYTIAPKMVTPPPVMPPPPAGSSGPAGARPGAAAGPNSWAGAVPPTGGDETDEEMDEATPTPTPASG